MELLTGVARLTWAVWEQVMNWFSNLKIGKKLTLGFGILEVLMIALGVFSIVQLSKVNFSTVDLATSWMPSIKILGDMRFIISTERRFELSHVMSADKKLEAEYEAKIGTQMDLLTTTEKQYELVISSPEERKLYDAFHDLWNKKLEIEKRTLDLSRESKKAEARDLALSTGREMFTAAADKLQEDVDLNNKGGDDAAKQGAAVYSSSRYWIFGILISAVVLGLIVATSLARSISSSATQMLAMIQE